MYERIATQLISLSARTISPGYLDEDALAEYAERKDRHVYAYLAGIPESGVEELGPADLDRDDCEVRGLALGGRYTSEEYGEVVSVSVDRILGTTCLREDDFPVSQFKGLAVDPDFQGHGIGTALSATAMAELLKNPPVVSMIWQRDNPSNRKIAEYYSDNRMATFEDYFPPEWQCPECGFDNDCDCGVVMYGWFADDRPIRQAPSVGAASASGPEEIRTANQ
ncbi:MAG: GNAT family N-acetyltransferase [Salinigranum sp.]